MDFNQSRRERPPVPADCRNCPGYSGPMPYEPWRNEISGPMRPRPVEPFRPMMPRPMESGRPMMPEHMGMPWNLQSQPVPYYMSYPYPLMMQGDDEDERDKEKIVSMFPKMARKIQPMVEDECDQMEYDGSLMFDEYPDRIMMEKIIDEIYDRMNLESMDENDLKEPDENSVFATQCRNCGNQNGLKDLISVLLFEEMHRRRCRHRRCKRWW